MQPTTNLSQLKVLNLGQLTVLNLSQLKIYKCNPSRTSKVFCKHSIWQITPLRNRMFFYPTGVSFTLIWVLQLGCFVHSNFSVHSSTPLRVFFLSNPGVRILCVQSHSKGCLTWVLQNAILLWLCIGLNMSSWSWLFNFPVFQVMLFLGWKIAIPEF